MTTARTATPSGPTDSAFTLSRQQIVMELAIAVAIPGSLAFLLGEDQDVLGRTSIAEAAASGKAFFVSVRDDVLAVDFDEPAAADTALDLYWLCRMAGLPAMLVASGQEDRRHVFAWHCNPAVRSELVKIARERGGDVRTSIRPPLAPHRLRREGLASDLLLPACPRAALEVAHSRMPGKAFTPGMRARVLHGGPDHYRSRSEFVAAVALAAVNAGWSREETLQMLTSASLAGSEAYLERETERGVDRTQDWFTQHVWPSAVRRERDHPAVRVDPNPLLARLYAAAVQFRWDGRAGASERAVYLAMLRKAELIGETEFHASRRELQQMSGLRSAPTVDKALDRLERKRFIEQRARRDETVDVQTGEIRFRRSRRWRLLAWFAGTWDLTDTCPRDMETLNHDAFQNVRGLGKNAQRVWEAVRRAPGTLPNDLSVGLGLTRRTVRKHLHALAEHRLAEPGQDDHWFPLQRQLDAVAADLGTYGNLARMKDCHRREREAYDESCEEKLRESAWRRGSSSSCTT